MKDNEKITIIIATENNAKTIVRAIESVIGGIRSANKVIVGDNDSTDGTYDVLCQFLGAEPIERDGQTGLPPEFEKGIDSVPIKIFRKQKTTTAHTLNVAMQMGHQGTTIFGFCDPASWFAPDKISQAIGVFQQFPVVACVVSDCDDHYPDGRIERQFKPAFDINRLTQSFPYDNNFLIRTQVFQKLQAGFTEQLQAREAYDLLSRASEIGLIYHIPSPLHTNTITEQSVSTQQLMLQSDQIVQQITAQRRQQGRTSGK